MSYFFKIAQKWGLRTEYKTRTSYKTRNTDYEYKNSFRKVKLRQTGSRWHKTGVPAPCLTHNHSFIWSHSLWLPNVNVMWGRKASCMNKEGDAAIQGI